MRWKKRLSAQHHLISYLKPFQRQLFQTRCNCYSRGRWITQPISRCYENPKALWKPTYSSFSRVMRNLWNKAQRYSVHYKIREKTAVLLGTGSISALHNPTQQASPNMSQMQKLDTLIINPPASSLSPALTPMSRNSNVQLSEDDISLGRVRK